MSALIWKQFGYAPAIHSTECQRFTIESEPKGHVAYRFEDLADVFPVENSGPMLLADAKAWCEERAELTPLEAE